MPLANPPAADLPASKPLAARPPAPYPLRLQPYFRDYLWGGRKLQTVLGKQIPETGIWAESWEIVDHAEHSSTITNGPLAGTTLAELAQQYPNWLSGTENSKEATATGRPQPERLPLLLKYLDCQRVLSVQVHPNDRYASRLSPPDLGKTEAWYIIASEPQGVLYAGLKAGVKASDLREALQAGQVENCLHAIYPQAGDCVFIPAGTVHALGAGLLVAEIQQASNTTFRLFDWNRVDAHGQPRDLHIEQSLEVIDFDSGPRPLQVPQPTPQAGRMRLVECDKFVLDCLRPAAADPSQVPRDQKIGGDGRLHLLTVPNGQAELTWSSPAEKHAENHSEQLTTGQSLLLPAALSEATVHLAPDTSLLDMY